MDTISLPQLDVPALCPFERVDRQLQTLTHRKKVWATVSREDRIHYLEACLQGVIAVADAWVETACQHKGIDPQSSLAGEEWIAGPVATLLNLRQLINSLQAHGKPTPVTLRQRPNGQTIAQVFPDNAMDRLLWWGFRGEVWIEPGQPASQGRVDLHNRAGALCLVLGAGNISSIAPMDALYKLFAENQVVLVKMNPVNAYMGAFLEQALRPLQQDGFFEVTYGGSELGRYLCHHPQVDAIHITGSHRTHDAIVWGEAQSEQTRRKADHTPMLTKPITSELGCVTPILVVPGNWSEADLRFQARQVASMVTHNASFNCVAAKVLVTAQGWPQQQAFLDRVQEELSRIPRRKAYYPGSHDRYQAFLSHYPQAVPIGAEGPVAPDELPWTILPEVPAQAGEYALTEEAFCGILAEVSLDSSDAGDFLAQAVPFANDQIWGNLSCVVLIDAQTQRDYHAQFNQAIADLRYGGIGVNVWSGIVYLAGVTSWGAYPGNPLPDIQSGQGVVHNSYFFDHPQKSVLYAPFRIYPTPIWFADHRNLRELARHYAALQAQPSWRRLGQIICAGLKG
ncbi:aldehyde dehydrogenase family protein [Lyngbya confervoides]|uniref:Aldehyde dehydrogenase family protein n=1 Tax=Lyngbya confervoides BDU141951 TaxID=1574623 RepID=A0ABD4T4T1_9CYAN|nr:aldehyde dehydrogenase family protein [Lyngbya confervoides]MCM1983664.1 aldehyde dehydrogenase family protein [Lyngbya confervoides BDU141951]